MQKCGATLAPSAKLQDITTKNMRLRIHTIARHLCDFDPHFQFSPCSGHEEFYLLEYNAV